MLVLLKYFVSHYFFYFACRTKHQVLVVGLCKADSFVFALVANCVTVEASQLQQLLSRPTIVCVPEIQLFRHQFASRFLFFWQFSPKLVVNSKLKFVAGLTCLVENQGLFQVVSELLFRSVTELPCLLGVLAYHTVLQLIS